MSTINGPVGHCVTLGINGYTSPLTIGPSGYILPGSTSGTSADGVYGSAGTAWTVVNQGTIKVATTLNFQDGAGIDLEGGGFVSNSGSIFGPVIIDGAPGTVIDSGIVSFGIDLFAGGYVGITASGTLPAGGAGVATGIGIDGTGTAVIAGAVQGTVEVQTGAVTVAQGGYLSSLAKVTSGTVVDAGRIVSHFSLGGPAGPGGINVGASGFAYVAATGLLEADVSAIYLGAEGTAVNAGTIVSYVNGVNLTSGGLIDNKSGGLISGGLYGSGVKLLLAATLTNEGRIHTTGTGAGAYFAVGGVGQNNGGLIENGVRVAYLAGNNAVVKFAQSDPFTFSNSGTVTGGVGIADANTAGVTISNYGMIAGPGGTAVHLGDGAEIVVVGTAAQFGGAIANLHTGDVIDFLGVAGNGVTYSGGILGLTNDGTAVTSVAVAGPGLALSRLHAAPDGHGGTDVTVGPGFANYYGATYLLIDAATQQPFTITAAGTIRSTTNFYAAVQGAEGLTAWTVVNYGTVASLTDTGVELPNGGFIRNGAAGVSSPVIYGNVIGADIFGSAATIANYATIVGGHYYGVFMNITGSTVTNAAGAAILAGGTHGMAVVLGNTASSLTAPSTIVNAGTIAGATGTAGAAVTFLTGVGDRLVVEPGAVFEGAIGLHGSASGGIVELAAAGGAVGAAGTFGGFGTSVTGFTTLQFDPGSRWTVSGSGSGFPAITGFAAGDTLDVTGFVAVGASFANNALVLTDAGNNQVTLGIEGSFATNSFRLTPDGAGGTDVSLRATAPDDFDGDGNSEILWRDSAGNVALWDMAGLTVAGSSLPGFADPAVWHVRGNGDFNGDGTSDILWRDSGGDVAIWFMDNSTVSSSGIVGTAALSFNEVATGDFNGDGKSDILWRDNSGDVAIWEINGATIASSGFVGFADASVWHIRGVGDFNGDGRSDILWQDAAGDVAIWNMNGLSIAASAIVGFADASVWHIRGTGDFNGDGRSDILWQDNAGDVAIWEMNGFTIAASAIVGFANPAQWHIAGAGDYNGDGKSDILWQDQSGDVAIWEMNGLSIAASGLVGFANPAKFSIVPPDSTGDTTVPAGAAAAGGVMPLPAAAPPPGPAMLPGSVPG